MPHRFQFTLRRLFLWTTIAGFVFWIVSGAFWFVVRVSSATAMIKSVGGDYNEDKAFINGTPITDEQFRVIAADPTLRVLWACGTKLGDDGIAHLRGSTVLDIAFLDRTLITDKSMESLATIRDMRWIAVNETNVTDEGLAAISDLPVLENLDLEGTRVTDKGLQHLETMPSLKCVNLNGSDVTAAGVARLRQALPECRILWGE